MLHSLLIVSGRTSAFCKANELLKKNPIDDHIFFLLHSVGGGGGGGPFFLYVHNTDIAGWVTWQIVHAAFSSDVTVRLNTVKM